jgi:phosphatidylserine decarboxylase
MGISSAEHLSEKREGKVRTYYRGPKYLFGKSVHDYRRINDWFKRDLTKNGRREFLKSAVAKENKLAEKFGDPQDASRLVISNSNSRLRFERLSPQEFGKPQILTGKVLNPEAEETAQKGQDDPAYYQERYAFSNKNLFGRKSTDSMAIRDIPIKLRRKYQEKQGRLIKLKQEQAKHPHGLFAIIRSVRIHRLENQLKKDPLIKAGKHEFLGGLYRFCERSGAVQVIQRLAPADIHNYVAPLNGTPLSQREAVDFIKEQLKARYKHMQNQDNPKELAVLKNEIRRFEDLSRIFEQQENILPSAMQATFDIRGTNASVSTPALQNQPRILGQNDRKIMVYRHEDGGFSVHVFIGATAVNRVDIDQERKKMRQGDRQGDMQIGTESGKDKLRMGEWQGGFPINGSTVISFYLPHDFAMLPKVENFKKRATYQDKGKMTDIEMKVRMGDPILAKTEIVWAEAMERWVIMDRPAQNLIEEFIKHPIADHLDAKSKQRRYLDHDQGIQQQLKNLWNKSPRTYEEEQLLDRLKKILEKRRETIASRKKPPTYKIEDF